MIHGRCQGCGRRTLLLSFRGQRCLSCVCMATEDRGDDPDVDWCQYEGEKLEPVAHAEKRMSPGPYFGQRGAMTDIKRSIVRAMRDDGHSLREIARAVGLSKTCIMKALKKSEAA